MSQFFYLTVANGEPVLGSFQLSKVMRTIEYNGGLVVLLEDGHEETRIRYKRDPSSGEVILEDGHPIEDGRVTEWVVSEIILDQIDAERFISKALSPQEIRNFDKRIEAFKAEIAEKAKIADVEDPEKAHVMRPV